MMALPMPVRTAVPRASPSDQQGVFRFVSHCSGSDLRPIDAAGSTCNLRLADSRFFAHSVLGTGGTITVSA